MWGRVRGEVGREGREGRGYCVKVGHDALSYLVEGKKEAGRMTRWIGG